MTRKTKRTLVGVDPNIGSPTVDSRLNDIASELRYEAGAANVSVEIAASLLGLSHQTIRRKIWAGELPAARFGGRRGKLTIRVADLARMVRRAEIDAIPLVPQSLERRVRRQVGAE